MPDRQPLRIAVVGAGGWGQQHARIFSGRPDTQLCAIVGRSAERAAARAAEYGTTAYVDIDEMLDAEQPRQRMPAQRGPLRPTLQLIRRGIPLLVEKPLVFDLDEADILLAEAASRPVLRDQLQPPVRGAFLRAKAAIDRGEIGRPAFATWRFGGEANHGTSRARQPHRDPVSRLRHARAPGRAHPLHRCAHDRHDVRRLEHSRSLPPIRRGAVGTMLGSYDSSYAYPDSQLLEINGTEGRLDVHDTVREFVIQRSGDPIEHRWRAGYFDDVARGFSNTFDRHVDLILDAFRAGEKPPVHARAGRRALALAQAAIQSHESGRLVKVGPPTV